jgi:hypothetical protein
VTRGRRLTISAAATLVLASAAMVPAVFAAPSALAANAPPEALDSRAWELVSPVEKSGGEVAVPAEGGGVFQAAAGGGAFAFGSATSFGEALGAAPANQYLASRGAGGWSTANLTPPLLTGTYSAGPYQLFSADLSRALLSSGWGCRGGAPECGEENAPLDADAPVGYRNLYLREGPTYTPLITTANSPALTIAPERFHLALVGASPDLSRVLFSTCAALTAGSSEVPDGAGGCDPDAPNFYEWSGGALTEVGAPLDWESEFDPGAEVTGVLGASDDRSYVYYANTSGLWLWHGGANTLVAAGASAAAPSDYPASTGTARVTPDGTHLAFLSTASLTGYANVGKTEVFIYDAVTKRLVCASCNPRGNTPFGPGAIAGALAAGEGGIPTYKPRNLSADGRRVFFTSADNLLLSDTDGRPDAYEWEANGSGSCTKAAGCLALISGGRSGEATFLDASADGTDAYFLTDASLLGSDTGSLDVYDARAGGGFPEPPPAIPCEGDDCQGPPPGPDDPTPGTAALGYPTNPPLRWPKKRCKPRRRPAGPQSCSRKPHRHRRGHRR